MPIDEKHASLVAKLRKERQRFADALTWIEVAHPGGIVLVAQALTAADDGRVHHDKEPDDADQE